MILCIILVKYLIVKNHHYIDVYKTKKNLQRKPRTAISYKVKKEQVKIALKLVDNNEQLTMDELLF